MKIFILTMSPGETSQCAAVAKYLLSKKNSIAFGYLPEVPPIILDDLHCSKYFFRTGGEVKRFIEQENFNLIILGNSKIFKSDRNFQNSPPKNKPLTISLDSNWLFKQPKSFPFVQWIDRIFVNLPEDVFQFGLKENGGAYKIDAEIKKKIKTVGLIPSYRQISPKTKRRIRMSLGIGQNDKLIFCYIGSGYTLRKEFRNKVIEIFDKLCKINQDIKVVYLSGEEPTDRNWLIKTGGKANSKDFNNYLAASDLVFQHQGFGTMEQAISAEVPIVANVAPIDKTLEHNTAWEIQPFERAGLCKMHFYNDSASAVLTSITDLLYTESGAEMAIIQKQHYSTGEKNFYGEIIKLL